MAREYGTGSVFQLKSGKWRGRYRDGYTASGNPRYRSVFANTEREAKTALRAALREKNRADAGGPASTDRRETVKGWATRWLEIRASQVRPKTFATDRGAVQNWIIPNIGARKLAELEPDDLRAVDSAVKRAGLSQATVKRTRDVLMLCLKAAAVEGYLVPSRLFMVAAPAVGESDRAAIPVDQAARMLALAGEDPRARSRWSVALLQGVRQAEALGLTWDHVDLDAGVMVIEWQAQQLTSEHGCKGDCGRKRAAFCYARRFQVPDAFEARQIAGSWHWTRPKTKAGKRVVPMVPWVTAALREWAKVAPASPHGLVWPAPGGGPLDPRDDLDAFHDLQRRADVMHPAGRRYHVHEARHTTATMLLAMGADPQIITAIMGHSSILSTRTYQHADLAMMRGALETMAGRLALTA